MISNDLSRSERRSYRLSSAELAELLQLPRGELIQRFRPDEVVDAVGRAPFLEPRAVRNFLEAAGGDFSFRVISHINMRGGIGKTTSTISLATRAAQYGFRVCVLDLDSQGSSSLALDCVPSEDDPVFYDIWQNPAEQLLPALKRVQDNLFVLPSSLENSLLDSAMARPASQKSAVHAACDVLRRDGFDLVVIDCPPSLGAAVISSICASHTVVIPVWSDPFSLKGMKLTVQEIEAISRTYGMEPPQIRVLFSRFDRREKASLQTLEYLRARYAAILLDPPIRTSSLFTIALARRESVFATHRASTAREDYDAYARGLLGLNPVFSAHGADERTANDLIVKEVRSHGDESDQEVEEEAVPGGGNLRPRGEELAGGNHVQQAD